jgi:hypothetical protein
MQLSRRSFLGGILSVSAVAVAPLAHVPRIVGDGIHDDTAGLQAAFDGAPFEADGFVMQRAGRLVISGGMFRTTGPLNLVGKSGVVIRDAMFAYEHNGACLSLDTCELTTVTGCCFYGRSEGDKSVAIKIA